MGGGGEGFKSQLGSKTSRDGGPKKTNKQTKNHGSEINIFWNLNWQTWILLTHQKLLNIFFHLEHPCFTVSDLVGCSSYLMDNFSINWEDSMMPLYFMDCTIISSTMYVNWHVIPITLQLLSQPRRIHVGPAVMWLSCYIKKFQWCIAVCICFFNINRRSARGKPFSIDDVHCYSNTESQQSETLSWYTINQLKERSAWTEPRKNWTLVTKRTARE